MMEWETVARTMAVTGIVLLINGILLYLITTNF